MLLKEMINSIIYRQGVNEAILNDRGQNEPEIVKDLAKYVKKKEITTIKSRNTEAKRTPNCWLTTDFADLKKFIS